MERIGQGGAGSLYLARDMELGALWAVKEIPAERKNEARLLLQLEHPGIPRMVDYAEREDFCYLVMEYIPGESLGDMLKRGKTFSPEEALRTGKAAAEILKYLHDQKPPVYYGDLKPDNLLLGTDGNLYLVDLGSAVFGYEGWGRGTEGTPGFAAPEQYEGKVGKTSDVYALGRTLRVLLGKNERQCFWKDPRLAWCLRKCCRRREGLRYQDMESLSAALSRLEKGRRRGRFPAAVCGAISGVMGILYLLGNQRSVSLESALSECTEAYYSSAFLRGDREEVCAEMDGKLQELLMKYREAGEQKKLLLLLALNGELMGKMERAALYYEQLLLYYPKEAEGYAEYGLFLCRLGQKESSERLWEKYCEEVEEGQNNGEKAEGNLRVWQERLGEN